MKKGIALILTAMLLVLSGCGQTPAQGGGDTLSVVCTIFPQYDWVRQILGGRADTMELTLLTDRGVDLHSYQPTVADMGKISECELFINVGGESDAWVPDALAEAENPGMVAINLLEAVGNAAKAEELVEGMEDDEHAHEEGEPHEEEGEHTEEHEDEEHEDEEHEGEEHEGEEHSHEGEVVLDEHVWLSLRNAEALCAVIANALSELDEDNAAIYAENLEAYNLKLRAADENYRAAADTAAVKTLLFGDRFPFRYLVDDYNIEYFAAFPGCSAETEASFETIAFLTDKTDELNLKCLMVTESSDKSIAETIIRNSAAQNQQILVLDAMQSVTAADIDGGATYLSIMESNLNILKEALK
ncbi:MAG: metal ABC transporter substrate-binding protein [Oscillospiraceae bacterium]|nr:metal ABC transporter substrate-binding protein [Oscillospiraceae bacterium]